jgi:hypothetical protein
VHGGAIVVLGVDRWRRREDLELLVLGGFYLSAVFIKERMDVIYLAFARRGESKLFDVNQLIQIVCSKALLLGQNHALLRTRSCGWEVKVAGRRRIEKLKYGPASPFNHDTSECHALKKREIETEPA